MENLNNECNAETNEQTVQNVTTPKKNKKIKLFLAILFIFTGLLVCYLMFLQRISVCVEISRENSDYNNSYYYKATLVQEKDNWEYRLYCDDKLIASKKSSDSSVIFYDIKVKKETRLRAEMVPLDNGKILDKELTITKELWEIITMDKEIRAEKRRTQGYGNYLYPWNIIKDGNDKIVISIKCN